MVDISTLSNQLPVDVRLRVLEEDCARDLVTARRLALLAILWQESRLSSIGLIARTEAILGQGCFGRAPAATFRRDMRALKQILAADGHALRFSRQTDWGGYYIVGRPDLGPELAASIEMAIADVDPRQIEIASRLSAADRVGQAGQLSDGLRRLAVRRLMAERPSLTPQAAQREVLHRYDQLGG